MQKTEINLSKLLYNYLKNENKISKERRMMFADYHVHTEFSDDSEYLMEEVVKDAIA